MHLMGAVIAPSEEDSQTFNVNAANGEIFKLRAHDAKERQYWVSTERECLEYMTGGMRKIFLRRDCNHSFVLKEHII